MNLKIRKIKQIAFLAMLLLSVGCQKESEELVKMKSSNELLESKISQEELDNLLTYLSQVTQFEKKELYFNPKDEHFYYRGVQQINLSFLRLSFSQK